MSRFHTPIPVDVSAIKALLPQRGLHIHGILVTHDEQHKDVKLVIDWESGELKTPYTFPVEFPADDLRGKKLPKGVSFVEKTPAPAPKAPATDPKAKAPAKPKAKAPAK